MASRITFSHEAVVIVDRPVKKNGDYLYINLTDDTMVVIMKCGAEGAYQIQVKRQYGSRWHWLFVYNRIVIPDRKICTQVMVDVLQDLLAATTLA